MAALIFGTALAFDAVAALLILVSPRLFLTRDHIGTALRPLVAAMSFAFALLALLAMLDGRRPEVVMAAVVLAVRHGGGAGAWFIAARMRRGPTWLPWGHLLLGVALVLLALKHPT